jgi:folate-binding protein YgfZ
LVVTPLWLHEFHKALNGCFGEVNGREVVEHYGDPLTEHAALRSSVGVLDLSLRERLSLTGADRQRFLNGQVTNKVKDLQPGQGCYAAVVTAKGRMQSDLNIYCLPDEFLLDFEPGLSAMLAARFEKYIIADDVQVVDAGPHYGLLSVQGPKAVETIPRLGLGWELPLTPMHFASVKDTNLGELYCMNQPRGAVAGFDLFVPTRALAAVADKLIAAAKDFGGRPCGWQALEMLRIESGIPRFGADMDESNLAPEVGIESRAISYTKGCYIGQEVIARIRTYGQVAKALRGLRLPDQLKEFPRRGDKLFHGDKEAGYLTSAVASPALRRNIALGYVRRECNQIGTELILRSATGKLPVKIVPLPFTSVDFAFA